MGGLLVGGLKLGSRTWAAAGGLGWALLVGLGCEASVRQDTNEPRKFQGPPDKILGPADMGEGVGVRGGWAAFGFG